MGRALLIITLGSFIVLGIIQQAVNNRQTTMTEGNIEAFMVSHGQNATGSALEMAIHRVMYDNSWGSAPLTWDYELDDFIVTVAVDDHDADPTAIQANELRLTSTLQLQNRTIRSFAFLDKGSVRLPEMLGALSVFGPNSRIRLDGVGAQLKVDGYDTNPEGVSAELGGNLPGITSITSEEDLFSQISGAASNKIFYDGEHEGESMPFRHDENLDAATLQELYEEYLEIGTPIDKNNLGTDNNPVISIVDSDTKLGDEPFGSGIMVIKPDVSLEITGNFTYHGLIIVGGKLEIAGTPSIYGGVTLMDTGAYEEALIQDPDDDHVEMSGTPGILYSSWVMNNLAENLTGGSGSKWALNRISY
ncbi:MAG: hypothetical protein R6U28_03410 [Cyclonatronaceae bacterium]